MSGSMALVEEAQQLSVFAVVDVHEAEERDRVVSSPPEWIQVTTLVVSLLRIGSQTLRI